MFMQRFTTQTCGDVVVCEYVNHKHVMVIFVNTGHITKTSKRVLSNARPRIRDPLAPTVFGVGCIGIGEHIAHDKGGDTVPFRIWRAMLRRCYYKPERKAWRAGQSVALEWLNFQTFAAWYKEHYPAHGTDYQLDKDIRVPGNKVYGPSFCKFVTRAENLAARRWEGTDARRHDADARADAMGLPRIR